MLLPHKELAPTRCIRSPKSEKSVNQDQASGLLRKVLATRNSVRSVIEISQPVLVSEDQFVELTVSLTPPSCASKVVDIHRVIKNGSTLFMACQYEAKIRTVYRIDNFDSIKRT